MLERKQPRPLFCTSTYNSGCRNWIVSRCLKGEGWEAVESVRLAEQKAAQATVCKRTYSAESMKWEASAVVGGRGG